jgi:hypothetical protein
MRISKKLGGIQNYWWWTVKSVSGEILKISAEKVDPDSHDRYF